MLTFPTALLVPSSVQAELAGVSISGGQSLSGQSQYGKTDGGGYWTFEFGAMSLWDRGALNQGKFNVMSAIAALADGGAMPFITPLCDRGHQPFLAADVKRGPGVGDSDNSTFSDGALWSAEYITATLAGSAALRATLLNINIAGAAPLGGGERFTIWHLARGQRLYQVAQVLSQGEGVAQIVIRPPLRQACADGVTLDFDNPRCQMHLVGPVAPVLDQLKFGKSPTLKFAEDFTPVGS